MTKPDRAYLGVEGRDSSDGTERSAVEEEESRPGTTQQRSCGRRQERRWRRVVLVPFFTNAVQGVHLVGGDPQSAGFCDGPGPGMAQERNPFLPPTTPGQGITVISASVGTT